MRPQLTEVSRHDVALGRIFDWEDIPPAQDTYKRFFSKFNQATNQAVINHFYTWIFDNFKFDHFTLNMDSLVITSDGEQDHMSLFRTFVLQEKTQKTL